jgi:23S rRNA pseudouridine1911/1915/1917 synthase
MKEINLVVSDSGDRLDTYLAQNLPEYSRSRLQKLIERGMVCINGGICQDKKVKVREGDRLLLVIPPNQPLNLEPEALELDILYEDEHLIIINKPAGLVVHPAPGHEVGTLVHRLLYHCPDLGGIGGVERPGIVHRLDKDTTGALVIAKTDYAHQHLQAQLKRKTARREYWGVVHGVMPEPTGSIDLPIGRHLGERKKMGIVPLEKGGRNALTHWEILERLGNYTLVEFRLDTGRTHQIRVHTSHLGHPLLGDPLYSSGQGIGVNLRGQVLHARRLILEHPVSGITLEAIAPLPAEFNKVLRVLRQRICLQS